jgi:hypothetical protein
MRDQSCCHRGHGLAYKAKRHSGPVWRSSAPGVEGKLTASDNATHVQGVVAIQEDFWWGKVDD